MSTVVITFNVTGPADTEDRRAMEYVITQENARRAALATPEAALPMSTATERRVSYETVMAPRMAEIHRSYINQSDVATLQEVRDKWPSATDAKRAAALAALQ